MAYGYIYKISFPNGKCYIGFTTRTIKERWVEHNKHAKAGNTRRLYNALRKYNMVDTFQMIVIDTAETEKELCEKEIAHIEIHNSHYKRGYGYNMTDGGDGIRGYFDDPEARQKQSEILKKYFEDPEARQKLSEAKKKYFKDNPEAIRKYSEAQKKRYEDNPEAIRKNSEAQKKRYEDPEERRKTSEANKKRYKDNPEAGQKHSEALKNYHKDNPEAGKVYGEYMKKCWKDNPEFRKKILDIKGQNKPFDVFEKDGTYIKSFNYKFEAREYLQTNYEIKIHIKIGEVLRGTRKSSAGYIFKYKE